ARLRQYVPRRGTFGSRRRGTGVGARLVLRCPVAPRRQPGVATRAHRQLPADARDHQVQRNGRSDRVRRGSQERGARGHLEEVTAPAMPRDRKTITSTEAVHAGEPRTKLFDAVPQPIVQTATYTYESTAEIVAQTSGKHARADREEYGRYGNP